MLALLATDEPVSPGTRPSSDEFLIRDFNDFDDGVTVAADICIVGAGAAGIAIAREFIGTAHSVVILEAGGFKSEPQDQKLYDSDVVGLPHSGIHIGRARVFGGTTTLWGGQALRFDAFDLREKSWIPYSGWPISIDTLEPYYARAERVLHLGPRIAHKDLCASFGIEAPAFDPEKLYMGCSQWSPKPNFGTAYREEIRSASNVTAVLHANVAAIVTNQNASTVDRIEFRTLAGKKGIAKARHYIICCGGIETARILLASDRVEPSGVGNRHDLVGRFFQEHIHIRCGELLTTNRNRLQNLFESFFSAGLKHAPLINLSERVQTEKLLLSVLGGVAFEPDPDSGIVAMKTLFRAVSGGSVPSRTELKRLLGNIVADPGEVLALTYRRYVQKRARTPKRGPIYFGAQCEMAPKPESRVMLGDGRDSIGMRRVQLDWRLGELERRTISEFARTMADELERLGLATVDRRQFAILDDPVAWLELAHDSAHHMGTARMHETPQLGVVDADCRVHGIDNLYVGSSAVFPTSARSNPTLTILALCLRIADRLKDALA
jgi:choline dehydrogenase-like flavoprotein